MWVPTAPNNLALWVLGGTSQFVLIIINLHFQSHHFYFKSALQEGNRGLSNYLQQGRWIPAFQLSFRCQMLFIIFKVQMISTQQVVQFHCLQIIRIYKQTIIRSHGFHGRSPIFFLQCNTFREYRFVIYWLMDLLVVGYYGGFTYKHPITILQIFTVQAKSLYSLKNLCI